LKFFLILVLSINFLFAKKDFYYGFINSSGNQISEQRKQAIIDGFDIIDNARNLAKEGKIDEAYAQVSSFKNTNDIKVLKSDTIILYSELALKKETKRIILNAAKDLEDSINSSLINEYDLAKAYSLLVELKLQTNKIDDAKYFSNIIINNFDDELTKTYGKISLAKVYKYQRNYFAATKTLYEILTKTKNKEVATIVADELFDVYILDNKYDEANELISQVLKNNIEFYANDSYLANLKVNKLIKAGMPEHATEILKELLSRTTKDESIEDFKYKLANTYMLMYDKTNYYLEKAKELYKDIINDYPNGIYSRDAKMYLDEILMRQGFLKPVVVASKYQNSESMEQKALLQELMNYKSDKKFDLVIKSKKVYKKISNSIAQRFGYESINAIFDEVNIEMIEDYLAQDKCYELNNVLKTTRKETLEKIAQDESLKTKFFECLIEVPYERAFLLLKDTFNSSRDANIYLYLEKMALGLNLIDEAIDLSAKVEMVDNQKVLEKEFMYKYQIAKKKNDGIMLDKFLYYAKFNPQFVTSNSNNPLIIDFYYDLYLYQLKNNEMSDAKETLIKLNNKQKEFEVYVYSPFVELELSKYEKEKNNNQKALEYLLNSLENARLIKPNDQAKIYYEIFKSYELLGNNTKKDEYLNKCKEVENTKDSFYKKMCDGL
jgi:predicted negative regulator of RcsB-dependent stress response